MSLTRFSINQASLKYSSLPEVIDAVGEIGASAIGVWRETVQELGASEVATRLADAGVRASSLCRGGFFTSPDPTAWRAALDDNRRAIEETAAIGAPALVLVAGGLPDGSRDLVGARQRVRDAIGELEADAQAAGVVLAIEALHPMYAADRAVISTLAQALDVAEQFSPVGVGVVVDTFHVWWDPELAAQVARAGRGGRIASYQVCDWLTPIAADALLSRGYPGDGHINFAAITGLVRDAGYAGDIEVEIFNQEIWDADRAVVALTAAERYESLVVPYL
jgi:sugar phosphate isomerase/epimerase